MLSYQPSQGQTRPQAHHTQIWRRLVSSCTLHSWLIRRLDAAKHGLFSNMAEYLPIHRQGTFFMIAKYALPAGNSTNRRGLAIGLEAYAS